MMVADEAEEAEEALAEVEVALAEVVVEVASEVGAVGDREGGAEEGGRCRQTAPTLCTWATCRTAWSRETWNSSSKISRYMSYNVGGTCQATQPDFRIHINYMIKWWVFLCVCGFLGVFFIRTQ